MAVNPNPVRITDELWRTWEETSAMTPGVRLGGIYAAKSGYHNTVNANKANWPGNYSIRLPLDLRGQFDKARAIDWTMSESEMIKRTGYLRRAALHQDDDRLRCMREFIGTLDGKNVYCLIRNADGLWEFDGGRDNSHLWHVHGSIFTIYVNDWSELRKLVSVWSGQTWEQWLIQEGDMPLNNTTDKEIIKAAVVEVLRDNSDASRIPWYSNAQRDRMVAAGHPSTGVPMRAHLTYVYELAVSMPPKLSEELDKILAAALDDGNVEVVVPPEMILILQEIKNSIVTSEEIENIVDTQLDQQSIGGADSD
jgi:hypothetical protein